MFVIMGKLKGSEAEELDTADTKKEALYLQGEYIMAFGSGWRIWIKKG